MSFCGLAIKSYIFLFILHANHNVENYYEIIIY